MMNISIVVSVIGAQDTIGKHDIAHAKTREPARVRNSAFAANLMPIHSKLVG
jgi:hypothetical protein